jgi:SAM-dependent methyltransferase
MADVLQNCPLCGSTEIREWLWATDPHYGIPGRHRLVRCGGCALVFLNPMYSDEELKALYPEDYYAYQEEVQAGRWKTRAKKLLGYWQGTKDPEVEVPGEMLDIGCGSGSFLATMRDRGWAVRGLEINENAARRAEAKGLDVFCGTLTAAQFPAESFDYIRASHSFEHMTRPHESLDEVYRLLRPQGKLLIAVPNHESFAARLFSRNWYHLCPPVHAFQYSVATLRQLLQMHNFDVIRVVFNSHYAGVLGSLQIWLNRDSQRRSFEGKAFNNHGLRVVAGWIENVADLFRWGDMIEVSAMKAPSRAVPFALTKETSRSAA